MVDDIVSQEIREFINRYVDSVAQLEALLLLRRHPETEWDVSIVAQRLYTSISVTQDALTRLALDGFLKATGTAFRYECRSAELARMVDALAYTYTHHLVPVTHIIHNKPARIHQFSDAFNLRKDK